MPDSATRKDPLANQSRAVPSYILESPWALWDEVECQSTEVGYISGILGFLMKHPESVTSDMLEDLADRLDNVGGHLSLYAYWGQKGLKGGEHETGRGVA